MVLGRFAECPAGGGEPIKITIKIMITIKLLHSTSFVLDFLADSRKYHQERGMWALQGILCKKANHSKRGACFYLGWGYQSTAKLRFISSPCPSPGQWSFICSTVRHRRPGAAIMEDSLPH